MKTLEKVLLGAGASLLLLGSLATPALAAGPSACGAVHGAFANINGNFGFLGDSGGTPGYHGGATGQDAGGNGLQQLAHGLPGLGKTVSGKKQKPRTGLLLFMQSG